MFYLGANKGRVGEVHAEPVNCYKEFGSSSEQEWEPSEDCEQISKTT